MNNQADSESVLLAELRQWAIRQGRNPYDNYYLYHMPTTYEHDGGIIIAKEAPPNTDYVLSDPIRINKTYSINQNFNRIRLQVLPYLPILSC